MDTKDGVGRRTEPAARAFMPIGAAVALVPELVDDFNGATDTVSLVARVLQRAVMETRSDRGVLSWIEGSEMIVAGCHDPFGEPVEVGSRLAWPVSAGGEHIAMLCVSRRRSEEFTAPDKQLLDVIARTAAQPLRAARLDDLLDAARTELAERVAGMESVERVKTDVLRLASHELRSPLTVLHGYISLIRGGFFGDLSDPLDDVMKILERRTGEMNSLVNDMLVAARVESDPAAEPETVDLRALVREAASSVAPRASAQHRLRVELPDEPALARVDAERVVLALRNLLDNAVKYSPDGGDVVCSVDVRASTARIHVADHGLGIAPEDRDKLFTRFGRVVTSANSHIPGIGLGLYFTREVARRHGGDAALVDGGDQRTVFELSLPLVR